MDPTTNFCGMYWSDGRFQPSTCPADTSPVDEFDFTCADHDCTLAHATTLDDFIKADIKFFRDNIGRGVKRTAAAALVKYGHVFFYPTMVAGASRQYSPFGDLGDIGAGSSSGNTDTYNPPKLPEGTNKSSDYARWVEEQKRIAEQNNKKSTPNMRVSSNYATTSVYTGRPIQHDYPYWRTLRNKTSRRRRKRRISN